MTNIKCKGCAHYQRTPIAVNDIGGGAYETACGLGKEDEFFTEEGCGEYVCYDADIVTAWDIVAAPTVSEAEEVSE